MTSENQAKLLMAYRLATIARQHDIADMLQDVILAEMKGANSVMRPPMTPKWLDDTLTSAFGSRNVVTCESGKEDTK